MTRNASIITVTSGKGGVGKTHISANIGVLFAKTGRKVCVLDADHGLANINLILGLPPVNQPRDLFEPNFDPLSCMIESEYGIDVLPSASGTSQNHYSSNPSKVQISLLIKKLKPHYDVILIDTAAGIDEGVRNYLSLSDHTLLIINSEPTSLTDAFGLVRRMKDVQPNYNILINRVSDAASATSIYKRFAGAVRKYIGAKVSATGYISEDSFMSAAVLSQTPVVSYSPSGLASQCLRRIVRTLSVKLTEEPFKNHRVELEQSESITSSPDLEAENAKQSSSLISEDLIEPEVINIEAEPSIPKFIQTEPELEPFENWLLQIKSFFDRKSNTEKMLEHRKRKLIQQLDDICDQDPAFLQALETLVVKSSDKNADSIIEQASISDRLAKTRFVEEPIIESGNNRLQGNGMSRAFSIISKFK